MNKMVPRYNEQIFDDSDNTKKISGGTLYMDESLVR